MAFGRNIEQNEMTCYVKEWQLCLSYFWHYLPLLYLPVIMHWFHVCYVSQTPFGIFWWYLVVMNNRTRWHVLYKNDNFGFIFTFGVKFPFLCLNLISCPCSVTWIPFGIFCFDNTWYKCRIGRADVLHTRMTTLAGLCCVCVCVCVWGGGGGHIFTFFFILFFSKNPFLVHIWFGPIFHCPLTLLCFCI